MCARFTLRRPEQIIEMLAPEEIEADLGQPRYNVAPTQHVPVLAIRDGKRVLQDATWGLVPPWAQDSPSRPRLFNARAETLSGKPAFRDAFRYRRCLIPADGFYEWAAAGKGKQPMYLRVDGGKCFVFGGLYEVRPPGSEGSSLTCVIITTEPNELMRPIHDRMPLILPESVYERWIDSAVIDPAELSKLLRPFEARRMDAYPVSPYVNSAAHEGEQCIEPI